MDLEKVQKKLNDGQYRSKEEFRYDITKIFDNARIYNQEETIYYKYANQLQNYVRPMLDRLKETPLNADQAASALDGPSTRKRGAANADTEMGQILMPEDDAKRNIGKPLRHK